MAALTSTWTSGCFRSQNEEKLLIQQATDTLAAFIAFERARPSGWGQIDAVELAFDVAIPEMHLKGWAISIAYSTYYS